MTVIRSAIKEDAPFILEMIKELATFEKAADQVEISLATLEKDGFGENPLYQSLIIENAEKRAIGFCLFYYRYSTWKGKSLYLEDLYIKPADRGNGAGKMVMEYLIDHAKTTNCGRFEWQVLDWNTKAIKLYESLGATLDASWINCRIEEQLKY